MNPYFFEKGKDGDAILDLDSKLVKNRILKINGDITIETSDAITSLLFLLDKLSSKDPIQIWINSEGGELAALVAIYDVMQMINCDIKTIAMGEVCSAATVILAAGTKGMRYATENSSIMAHQVRGRLAGGTVTDIDIEMQEWNRANDRVFRMLSDCTEKSFDQIKSDIDRDRWFTPTEAKEYGIIDHVMKNGKAKISDGSGKTVSKKKKVQ